MAGPDLATAWCSGVGLSRSAHATASEGEAAAVSVRAPHSCVAACGSGEAACGSAAAAEGDAAEGAAPAAGKGAGAGQGGACGAAAAGAAAGGAGAAAGAAAAGALIPQSSREGAECGARRDAAPEAASTRKAKRARGAPGGATGPQVALPSDYRGRCAPRWAGSSAARRKATRQAERVAHIQTLSAHAVVQCRTGADQPGGPVLSLPYPRPSSRMQVEPRALPGRARPAGRRAAPHAGRGGAAIRAALAAARGGAQGRRRAPSFSCRLSAAVRAMRGLGRPLWMQGPGRADAAILAGCFQGSQHCIMHIASSTRPVTHTCACQASGSCWTAPARIAFKILHLDLHFPARERAGDTGLLDHLLKHLADEAVSPCGEVLRRRQNAQGHMEYWLQPPAATPAGARAHAALHAQGGAWPVVPYPDFSYCMRCSDSCSR